MLLRKTIAGIKIRRHEFLSDLLSRLWGQKLSLRQIKKMEFKLVCTDMKIRKLSGAEFVSATLRDGIYGFAYPQKKEIHFWCKTNISKKKVLGFFGHEVGHVLEKNILKKAKNVKNEVGAEKFAEEIRHAIEIVHKIVKHVFQGMNLF